MNLVRYYSNLWHISNLFLPCCIVWKIVPGFLTILIKSKYNATCQFLIDKFCFFLLSQNAPLKPYHDWFFSNCIRLVNQKGSRFRTQSSKTSKIFTESVAFYCLGNCFMIQLIYSKVFSTWCNKTKHNVITFEDDRMVEENTKDVISQERNLTFRWNQKLFIFKNYYVIPEKLYFLK